MIPKDQWKVYSVNCKDMCRNNTFKYTNLSSLHTMKYESLAYSEKKQTIRLNI